MDFKTEVLNRKEEIISDLKEMVAIKSIIDEDHKTENAPFGPNIRKALDRFIEMAKRDGFKWKDIDGYAGYIEYGEGEELVGVLGHLDVVPLGENWDFDPLGCEEQDGYLFGRGTSDDKGPTMAAYHALKILKDNNIKLNRRVRLIVGCDEETGFRCMEYYKQHEEVPAYGFVPDANFPVIYGEKGIAYAYLDSEYDTIITEMNSGEVGNVVMGIADATISEALKVEEFETFLKENNLKGSAENQTYHVEGTFAHAMAPQDGVNAGVHLLNFIGKAHNDKYALVMGELIHSYHGEGLGINFDGKYMGPLTMNVGVVRISDKQQRVLLDMRYPDGMTSEKLFSDIKSKVEPLDIKMVIDSDKDMVFLDPEGDMIKILETIYREEADDYESPLITMGGGTYAKAFENHVAYGMEFPLIKHPEIVGDVHQANEAVSIEALLTGTRIYARAIVKLCNM